MSWREVNMKKTIKTLNDKWNHEEFQEKIVKFYGILGIVLYIKIFNKYLVGNFKTALMPVTLFLVFRQILTEIHRLTKHMPSIITYICTKKEEISSNTWNHTSVFNWLDDFELCLRMNGSKANSRLASPGPQWAVVPRDDYYIGVYKYLNY